MEIVRLHKIGPIEDCEISIRDFLVFTGAQATGKSTIAKAVFFFNNLKNLLTDTMRNIIARENTMVGLKDRFIKAVRGNFIQIFGAVSVMDPEMEIEYHYENGNRVVISIQKEQVQVDLNLMLQNEIDQLEYRFLSDKTWSGWLNFEEIRRIITDRAFGNLEEIIYIPAGRSMITLLGTQMNYLYSMMDDQQKRSMDYCTQSFLERIIRIKPYFTADFFSLIAQETSINDRNLPFMLLEYAAAINQKVLKGSYNNISGNESLQISKGPSIRINYASSGQQEALWIFNVLFYYMIHGTRSYFIIEEPESHLYPDAQKLITEFIVLTLRADNRVLLTTHSPYVLGSINNLLYANKISSFVDQRKLQGLCNRYTWLDFQQTGAYYLENGYARSCTDSVNGNIENDVIDGASEEINRIYEEMVRLVYNEKGEQ